MSDFVLECQEVNHWFGPKKVLYDINLKVLRGQVVAIVGPSGCGKSTLLYAILGTHPPRSGRVLVNGRVVLQPGRDRGMVYQRYSLFPFLTAQENVALGPMLDRTSLPFRLFRFWKWSKLRKAHMEEAAHMLEKVKLKDSMHCYPSEMSGGMCQRVAIAQTLIMKPELMLLDEPFGALDEATREELQEVLIELYNDNVEAKRAGQRPLYTILIVTHELNEAMYVSDRVIGLSQYWAWQETNLAAHPGATIVYDAVSPVFPAEKERRYLDFLHQREEIRRVAFDSTVLQSRGDHLRFWKEVEEGKGRGLLRV